MFDEDVEDFLEHFGVRGMRWGQRKTPSNTTFDRQTRGLSDKELNRRIERMELERHYSSLNGPQRTAGQEYVRNLLGSSGSAIITAGLGAVATHFVGRYLRTRFGG